VYVMAPRGTATAHMQYLMATLSGSGRNEFSLVSKGCLCARHWFVPGRGVSAC
jgi:hypothetical protein